VSNDHRRSVMTEINVVVTGPEAERRLAAY
jgi:hypothetical protein